jgi:hypothetical protein
MGRASRLKQWGRALILLAADLPRRKSKLRSSVARMPDVLRDFNGYLVPSRARSSARPCSLLAWVGVVKEELRTGLIAARALGTPDDLHPLSCALLRPP